MDRRPFPCRVGVGAHDVIFRGTLCKGRWNRIRGWARACTDLVLPPQCAFCEGEIEPGVEGPMLCASCRSILAPPMGPTCARCAAPVDAVRSSSSVSSTEARDGCPLCRDTTLAFQGIVALGVHANELQRAVLRMKHERHERLALAVGSLLAERVGEPMASADAIVPMPMMWRRRLVRQINAPELMAAAMGRRLGIRLEIEVLAWRRNVALQGSLLPGARRKNVAGAIRIRSGCNLLGAHILLVDDTMTTGATANAAARALRLAGATRVSVAVAARGIGVT